MQIEKKSRNATLSNGILIGMGCMGLVFGFGLWWLVDMIIRSVPESVLPAGNISTVNMVLLLIAVVSMAEIMCGAVMEASQREKIK